mmetsp:Transcript_18864/g.60541  ORF Transcript_18864/g.60541 Transcript_18864/m.60541 type:complete len:416 (-) Transcript_18864:26-1273(-)
MKVWWLAPLNMLSVASGFSSITHAKDKIIYIVRHGEKIDGNFDQNELQHEAQCLSEKGWARSYNLKSVFGTKDSSARKDLKKPEAIFSCNYAEPLDCRDHNGMFRTQQLVAAVADGLDLTVDNSTGFIPSLCGMVWNNESKKGYMDHKIGKHGGGQPPKYANEFKKWLDAEPACDPAIPNDCITQDGRAGHFNANASCHVRGFGGNKTDGTCCNQHAADMMLKKLDEVDYILVGWEHANINYLGASLAKMEYDDFLAEAGDWDRSDYDRIYEMHFTPDGHGSYEYKPDGSNYDKRQDFDYPEKANYTSPDDGTPLAPNGTVDDSEVLHKAYLGPQAYCGAVFKTLYKNEKKPFSNANITSSLEGKDIVNGPNWIGPPLDRTQPRDDSACFGQVFDKDAVDTNKNSDSKCYEYPVP